MTVRNFDDDAKKLESVWVATLLYDTNCLSKLIMTVLTSQVSSVNTANLTSN